MIAVSSGRAKSATTRRVAGGASSKTAAAIANNAISAKILRAMSFLVSMAHPPCAATTATLGAYGRTRSKHSPRISEILPCQVGTPVLSIEPAYRLGGGRMRQ